MRIQLRFGSAFQSARITLTFWYVVFFVFIVSVLSVLFYFRASNTLDREFLRISNRVQESQRRRLDGLGQAQPTFRLDDVVDIDDLQEAKKTIALQLVFINFGLASFAAIAGYFLAGKTLQPIEKMIQQQTDFIDNASHQLKTPIASLKIATEVGLLEKKLPTKTRQLLTANMEEIKYLELLAHKLLAFDTPQQEMTKISVAKTIKQAIQLIEPMAEQKNIHISQKLSKTVIVGNALHLVELWTILLENAVKYSPPKTSITVTSNQTKKGLSIVIADEGYGIAKNELDSLFERFKRGSAVFKAGNVSGSGLGLSIAQEIVEEHHATLSFKSNKKGTDCIVMFEKFLVSKKD